MRTLLLLLALLSLPAGAETLRVGMSLPGQVPFFWQDESGVYRGIYVDTLALIAAEIGVELQYVPLSQARLLKHFEIGEIDIEAGVSATEPGNPALRAVSLFTHEFGLVNEVIIYHPELSFPTFILSDLRGRRVATVRGAEVPAYLQREDFADERQIALRVHRGWNHIGLMKEAQALHYQRTLALNYEISLPYASNPVAFRLHLQRAQWLAPMNQAIAKLKADGTLDRLVCKYLCGTQ